MKKTLINLIGVVQLIEGVYVLYKLIPIVLTYYEPTPPFLIVAGVSLISALALFLSGIGLFLKKNWSIVLSVLPVLLPILLVVVVPLSRIPLLGGYMIIAINVVIAIYLLAQWNKLRNI